MRNRRRNKDMERRRKQQRQVMRLAFGALMALVVFAVVWLIWDIQNRRWIMTFEGDRIAVTDYRLFLSFAGGNSDAAMHELKTTLTVMNRANIHGVGATLEELVEMEGFAAMFRQFGVQNDGFDTWYFINDRRIAELLAPQEYVMHRLLDIYVPTAPISEAELAEATAEYVAENLDNYADIETLFIVASAENMEQVLYLLSLGEQSFEEILREYSLLAPPDEDDELETTSMDDLMWQLSLPPESVNQIISLQEGEISTVVETAFDDVLLIAYIYSREDADIAEVEENFRERFEFQARVEIFHEIVEGWVNNANYSINHRVQNAI